MSQGKSKLPIIRLPLGYHPLEALEHLEAESKFSLNSTGGLPPPRPIKVPDSFRLAFKKNYFTLK